MNKKYTFLGDLSIEKHNSNKTIQQCAMMGHFSQGGTAKSEKLHDGITKCWCDECLIEWNIIIKND